MRGTHEEPITRRTLRSLAAWDRGLVVSIFHPTFRATFHKGQNRDRLKTLIARSDALLAARGLKAPERDRFLDPARHLVRNTEFWRDRLEGLAVFVSKTDLRSYRVSFTVPELAVVSTAPCVRPLLPAVAAEGHFYLLAVSRNIVRLFQGSRAEMRELDLAQLRIPLSLADATRYDDFSRQVQSHATGRSEPRLKTHSQAGARAGRHVWHGHGSGAEQVKEQIGRFFRAVDDGVCTLLSGGSAPLILAAVRYEQDLYRSASRYPNIIVEGVEGNPDRLSPKTLFGAAWPIARRSLQTPITTACGAYLEASSAGQATDDLAEVIRAAYEGRVSTLLLRSGAERWGSYDPRTARLETDAETPRAEDLLDLAVRQTLLHGGDAYVVEAAQMPTLRPVAAVFRY